ncbi:hypothetical protein UFOVP150_5 [uncultured Caudovirales phage]|uniref:Phage neck terminator protein gp12-like domain-containing protein n=1 Tax=uncultured Caudovirales phage TaxID=2100421 RepID=A0A6J7WDD7_9CAUD|nr:hypothetical protein UFOVP150_5 [uncultured Caudovirales phage]
MLPSITDNDVFKALGDFLVAVLPTSTPIMQTQDNLVGMPISGFVTMNNSSKKRLATNIHTYEKTTPIVGYKHVMVSTQYNIHLDLYGPDSGMWAATVQTLFRDEFATSIMPSNIQPLHADDPIQLPLIDGERNYTERWKLQVYMQYNPIVTVAQQFAIAIEPVGNVVEAHF